MPPHNDNNNNSQENSNNDKNSKNMALESSETLPALEEQGDSKLVPPPTTIQTENSQDGSVDTLNDNLGDVSLTPVASTDIQNNDSADGNGDGDGDDDDDVVVVDPWAQVATATATVADGESIAVAEGEGDATATDVVEKKTLGDRWGSFRNRWEQQWEAKKNAATPYTSNPDEPATAAISPPKNMDDDVMEEDTTANNKTANTNTSTPATGPFARFRSGAGANPKKAATVVTDPSQVLSAEDMASFRANRISMTLQKDSQDSKWGFGMEQEPPASQKGGKFRGRGNGKSDKVRIAVMAGMGLLEHAPFQVGDTLVSVNNQKCTHAETTIQELVKMEGGSLVTLLVETPQGNPNLVQAMVRKPSNKKEGDDAADDSNNLGIGFYTPAALAAEEDAKKEAEAAAAAAADEKGEEEAKSEITAKDKESTMYDDEEAAKKPPVNKSAAASAAVADDPTSKLLRINHIDANGLLAQSVLSQGDIVVAINATPCSQMTPEQAMELLEQSTDSVTIIAMKPPAEATSRLQRWKKHARRAGIAIGGGTMVGVGLIFIPTLPPPFGEVLIVGGVSVLGTEFEAPKRVMRSARDSLERAVGREGEPLKIQDAPSPAAEGEEGADGASETASTTTPTTTTDTDGEATLSEETAAGAAAVAPQKKTMGTRFKSFGRNVVLPFLDQVVGDRKEETKKEEESPSSPTAANPVNESTTNTEAAEEETAASVTTAISETSVVGPDPEESSIPNATPTTTDEGETAVSSSSS